MTYIEPVLSLVILLLVLSRLGPRRRLKLRNRLLMFATIILFLWSWPVVAKLTSATLECWYFGDAMPGGDADAIVVLSAGAFLFYPEPPGPVAGEHTYVRTRYAAWLYRQWKQAPVLTSGGEIDSPEGRRITISEVMKEILVNEGVPTEMAWTETKSHSTYENALYSAKLLRERGITHIALVTEAHHMLRAEKCFRKQGLGVVPAPCRFRSLPWRFEWRDFVPASKGIAHNEDCLHEWIGLLWYWMSGKI